MSNNPFDEYPVEQGVVLPESSNFEILQTRIDEFRASGNSLSQKDAIDLIEQINAMNRTDSAGACILAEQTLSISREMGFDMGIAKSLSAIGISHSYRGEYEKALDCSLKALAIFSAMNNSAGLSSTLNTIGIIYRKLDNYDKSLEYYTNSLLISKKADDARQIANTTNNICVLYQDLNEFENALEFARKSLHYFTALKDDLGIGSSLNNIGIILEFQGNFISALEHFQKSNDIFQRIGYLPGLSATCNNLGELFTRQKKFKKAKRYFSTALKAAKDTNTKDHEICSLENLSILYETMGDFQKALEYYIQYSDLKQQVFSEESAKNINQLQVSYETEKKEKENEIFRLRNIELAKANEELEKALSEVKELSGLLPICSSCKKVRADSGYWVQIEKYISKRSNTQFSHGLCPDCVKKLYPEFSDGNA
ncbi:MAG: tetratricopeptide repeat protein [Candidatus Sabulitectum sp.]|nr:tetratricopeptide repeat protein [Candidatus Sabulitectum sp.]